MQEIKIVVTMDCERPTADTDPVASGSPNFPDGGDPDPRLTPNIAAEYGWPVTFFVHPGKRPSRRQICSENWNRRAIASVFIFTPGGSTSRFHCELGALSGSGGAGAMLSRAIEMWREASEWATAIYSARWTLSANDSRSPGPRRSRFPGRLRLIARARLSGQTRRLGRCAARPASGPPRLPPSRRAARIRQYADLGRHVPTERKGRHGILLADLRPDCRCGLDYLQMARNIVAQLRRTRSGDPLAPIALTRTTITTSPIRRAGSDATTETSSPQSRQPATRRTSKNGRRNAFRGDRRRGFKRTLWRRARIRQVRRPRLPERRRPPSLAPRAPLRPSLETPHCRAARLSPADQGSGARSASAFHEDSALRELLNAVSGDDVVELPNRAARRLAFRIFRRGISGGSNIDKGAADLLLG